MPYFAEKLFFPLNESVRTVAISTTAYVPRINLNLSGSLDSNGTAYSGAGGTPIGLVMARDNPNYMVMSNNSGSSIAAGFYSTNGGSTFTSVGINSGFVIGSCISDNGQFMLVTSGAGSGPAIYSTNYGSSWTTKNTPGANPATVCCSSDGQKVFFAPGATNQATGSISLNQMSTLSSVTLPATGWYGCCMTGDGSRIWIARYANVANKLVYYSDNNGSSWTSVVVDSAITSNHAQFIKCSKDGRHLIVGAPNADVYVSNNFGATWTKKTMSENVYGLSVNVSSSGRYMVVVSTVTNGRFFYSKNFGSTWTSKTISASTTQFRNIAIEEQMS